MRRQETGRERLQQTLIRLGRKGAPKVRRETSAASRSDLRREPSAPASAPASRPVDELQGRMSELAASIMERFDVLDRRLGEEKREEDTGVSELADWLAERLEGIEGRLAELTRPARPIPATRELFAEWVRLRKWEEMAFGDFLRLRRSGIV